MKRTIKLKESELRRMISESVRRVFRESTRPHKSIGRRINEGGHLYHQDDDGTIYTNSKERYRGVPGTTFIWHGNNADPEVIYKGKSFNVNDVEDNLWYTYKDECEENGEHPTDQGFEAWLQEVGTSYIATTLDEILYSTQG